MCSSRKAYTVFNKRILVIKVFVYIICNQSNPICQKYAQSDEEIIIEDGFDKLKIDDHGLTQQQREVVIKKDVKPNKLPQQSE